MPAGDSGRLDQDQRVLPARPPASQTDPEQTVGRPEASISTSEDAHLVPYGENLQEEIQAREQAGPERRDHPEGVTHPP